MYCSVLAHSRPPSRPLFSVSIHSATPHDPIGELPPRDCSRVKCGATQSVCTLNFFFYLSIFLIKYMGSLFGKSILGGLRHIVTIPLEHHRCAQPEQRNRRRTSNLLYFIIFVRHVDLVFCVSKRSARCDSFVSVQRDIGCLGGLGVVMGLRCGWTLIENPFGTWRRKMCGLFIN